ncbi:MAG: ABC transporter permease [Anaerolineae bacterium]|nr:ABC transporter permease [Anaerolineae bacterium]NUQ03501.1 ABC transporter permease [Anaerolineae bacterium]
MTQIKTPAPPTAKATGAMLFWRTMWARAYPRIVGSLVRERSWLFFETVLPLAATAGYVFVYQAVGAPEEYVGFVVLGGAMTAFWLNILWAMASQLYWDKEGGNLEIYILSPGPLMAILLGMAVGGFVMTVTRAAIILIVCSLAFSVTYTISSVPLLIAIFFLTMIALYGMGMMFAAVFLASGREAWHLANLLQEPIYLASGFYFPVRALGFWVAAASSLIPLTLGMDGMRQLLFAGDATLGFLSVEVEAIILLILSVFFLAAARFMLTKLEEIGRREGRLIERRR